MTTAALFSVHLTDKVVNLLVLLVQLKLYLLVVLLTLLELPLESLDLNLLLSQQLFEMFQFLLIFGTQCLLLLVLQSDLEMGDGPVQFDVLF